MVAELVALVVVLLAVAAETLHARRIRRIAQLAFGPGQRPRIWARAAPFARVVSLGAIAWGLVTLMFIQPKVHRAEKLDKGKLRHLLLVLDVSPSMRLQDAGPTKKEARMERARGLMDSFFTRAPVPFRTSVVGFYNGAKPVVVDTLDSEVVRNILGDLPMNYAFEIGQTNLFEGLSEAARMARPWEPGSTSVLILSDGDTVPASGMPKMPASVSRILVVGVGDTRSGSFIDGRQSRQDASTLRQVAVRLGGQYHDGNEKQIPTDMINAASQKLEAGPFEKLTRREYALIACFAGSLLLTLLSVALHAFGTPWRPGTPKRALGGPGDGKFGRAGASEFDTELAGSIR